MPAAPACPSLARLDSYLSGELPPADADAYRRHLAECLYCQAAASIRPAASVAALELPADDTHRPTATVGQATDTTSRVELSIHPESIADADWEELPSPPGPDDD